MIRILIRHVPVAAALLAVGISDPVSVPSAMAAETITGKARIVSGDIIEINHRQIRLFGIDAPEPDQTCTAAGTSWPCGRNADFALAAIVERQWVYCAPKPGTRGDRILAVCRLAGSNGPDIGAAMVRQGWALADPRQSRVYAAEEEAARRAKAGLWVGSFTLPWEWRR